MKREINFGHRKIGFSLMYTRRKTLGIKVYPDATVEVIAPLNFPEDQVLEKVMKKAAWICKQLDHFNIYVAVTPPRRYISGETHLYLGRQYRLKVELAEHNGIKAHRGQLWIYSRSMSPAAVRKILHKWYRGKATVVFRALLDEIVPRLKRYGVEMPALLIRTMAKRWGSCTQAGRIVLNTELVRAPKGCIEYVIVHELCHLVHHDHTKAFRALLNRVMPDCEKWKKRLEVGMI